MAAVEVEQEESRPQQALADAEKMFSLSPPFFFAPDPSARKGLV